MQLDSPHLDLQNKSYAHFGVSDTSYHSIFHCIFICPKPDLQVGHGLELDDLSL